MSETTSSFVHKYPSVSLVSNLMDALSVPSGPTLEDGTPTHGVSGDGLDGTKSAFRWQAGLLITSQNRRERLLRAIDNLERLPPDRRQASTKRLRAILLSESPPAEQIAPIDRAPKRAQRFVAFLVTEIQRALGASLDEAINMTSTVSRMTPGLGFIGESTLRSWYNKSGPNFRGLKQLASWCVAYWKRLAYVEIETVLDGVRPGYRVAEAAAKHGVITSTELASVKTLAIKILHALREICEAVENAPRPAIRNGWENVNIRQVSKQALPMLGF